MWFGLQTGVVCGAVAEQQAADERHAGQTVQAGAGQQRMIISTVFVAGDSNCVWRKIDGY
jgi:hypothetical protein